MKLRTHKLWTHACVGLLIGILLNMSMGSVGFAFWDQAALELPDGELQIDMLSPLDSFLSGGERFKRYQIHVKKGDSIRVEVWSPTFSPYLIVRGAHTNRDMGGESGLDRVVLEFRAWQDEDLDVFVTTARAGEYGGYTILYEHTRAESNDTSTSQQHLDGTLVANGHIQGAITPSSDRTRSSIFVARYGYQGRAGQHIRLRAKSRDFVPLVMIHGPNLAVRSGSRATNEGEVDLDTTLPEDGVYVVRVLADATVTEATYELFLSVEDERDGDPTLVRQLAVGSSVEGELDDQDSNRGQGQLFERYVLHLNEGEQVGITLESEDFDAYLIVQFPDHGGDESDDMAEDNANAYLKFRAPITGDYEVLASSYRRGETGKFQLRVDSEGAASTIQTPVGEQERTMPRLEPGRVMRARLQAGDAQMMDDSYYRAYTLHVEKDEQWDIEMQSQVFVPHLEIRGENGFAQTEEAESTGTEGAHVSFRAPEAQEITVYATSHRPLTTGPFTLSAYRGDKERPFQRRDSGRIIALMVGISTYNRTDIPNLPYCSTDAVQVKQALTKTGILAPESILLLDAAATREGLVSALEQVANTVGPNDVFLFFYSGHGGQLPSDDPGELDGLDETLILVDEPIRDKAFADLVMNINSRLSVMVIDACYSGGFRDELRRRKNQIGIFSSEEDVESIVAQEFEAGGYLAHILANALVSSGTTSTPDGRVSVDEFLQYIRRSWADLGQIFALDANDQFAHQQLVIERGVTSPQETLLWTPEVQH